MDRFASEVDALRRRYDRRDDARRYGLGRPEVGLMLEERDRAMRERLADRGWDDPSARDATEIGCGEGNVLSRLIELGFDPGRLTGIDLLPESVAAARRKLPDGVRLLTGDARVAAIAPASQDLVLCFTVFSSILDAAFRRALAGAVWGWLRPGGAVLLYDFTVDNPFNRDVRGLPLSEIRALFPRGRLLARRLTLAPPLARAAARVHPALYRVLAALPPLRTHVMAWVEKPAG